MEQFSDMVKTHMEQYFGNGYQISCSYHLSGLRSGRMQEGQEFRGDLSGYDFWRCKESA